MGRLLAKLLEQAAKLFSRRRPTPPARPRDARRQANEQGSDSRQREDCGQRCAPPPSQRAPADLKSKAKLERQMEERGWTYDSIEEAVRGGQRFPARNNQTGGSATRYIHPQNGRSVIIDDTTGGIIQVGGNGFVF